MEDILSEESRADKAEAEYEGALAQHAHLEQKLANRPVRREDQKELALLSLQVQSFLRAALEARLSAILARKNLLGETPDATKLTEDIRKIAYQLNLARIGKRVSEYIKDYYEQPDRSETTL